jgi:lysophospholipase L1-like esterase
MVRVRLVRLRWLIATLVVSAAAVACGGDSNGPTAPPAGPFTQCPADLQVDSPSGVPVPVNYAPPGASGGTPPYSVSCDPPSGTAIGLGTRSVRCNVTDAAGRSATCSFNVTVVRPPRLRVSRFLAFGDSLTEGALLETPTARLIDEPNSYPARLERMLQAYFRAQPLVVLNDGHGGERISQPYAPTGSPGGLVRLPRSIDGNRPEVVLLMEGTNDLMADSLDEGVDGLRKMIELVHDRGLRALVATIPPMRVGGPKGISQEVVEMVPKFNDGVRLAALREGAMLVDVYSLLKDRPETIGPDHLHLTATGYEIVAQAFYEAIKREFEVPSAAP